MSLRQHRFTWALSQGTPWGPQTEHRIGDTVFTYFTVAPGRSYPAFRADVELGELVNS